MVGEKSHYFWHPASARRPDLQGPVRQRVAKFSRALESGSGGFFHRFRGSETFNVLLVVKALPLELEKLLHADNSDMEGDGFRGLREHATVLYDDRAPDEDAHYWYGGSHARGAIVIVRPDLWIGMSTWPEKVEDISNYFDSFLVAFDGSRPVDKAQKLANGTSNHVNVSLNGQTG